MKLTSLLLIVSSLLGADAGPVKPLTRDRVVGEVEIATPGSPEHVRLCRIGTYVEPLACGGFIRGTWRLDDGGVALDATEACRIEGVPGTELPGASAECEFFGEYRFLGCSDGVAGGRTRIDAEEVTAMLGASPNDPDARYRLHRTAEPRACDRRWRPRSVSEAKSGAQW